MVSQKSGARERIIFRQEPSGPSLVKRTLAWDWDKGEMKLFRIVSGIQGGQNGAGFGQGQLGQDPFRSVRTPEGHRVTLSECPGPATPGPAVRLFHEDPVGEYRTPRWWWTNASCSACLAGDPVQPGRLSWNLNSDIRLLRAGSIRKTLSTACRFRGRSCVWRADMLQRRLIIKWILELNPPINAGNFMAENFLIPARKY